MIGQDPTRRRPTTRSNLRLYTLTYKQHIIKVPSIQATRILKGHMSQWPEPPARVPLNAVGGTNYKGNVFNHVTPHHN